MVGDMVSGAIVLVSAVSRVVDVRDVVSGAAMVAVALRIAVSKAIVLGRWCWGISCSFSSVPTLLFFLNTTPPYLYGHTSPIRISVFYSTKMYVAHTKDFF